MPHNYPQAWQYRFDENRLGRSGSVHRASQLAYAGFPWSAVPRMMPLTPADQSVFAQARIVGIGDGFTVPPTCRANSPGPSPSRWSRANLGSFTRSPRSSALPRSRPPAGSPRSASCGPHRSGQSPTGNATAIAIEPDTPLCLARTGIWSPTSRQSTDPRRRYRYRSGGPEHLPRGRTRAKLKRKCVHDVT
jgi:hypothetical protein